MSAIIDIEMPAPMMKPRSKWDDEYAAYVKLLPGLIAEGHEGKYVAVHEGRIIGIGEDKFALADEAYQRFGYQAILVKEVSPMERIVRIPSVHVVRPGNQ